MAMMDDSSVLIAHIRNAFITSDDTGMCEMIIDSEEQVDRRHSGSEKRSTWHGSRCAEAGGSLSDSGLESDTELAHSFDIVPDMDFAGHRRRSNTAQRLEKLKREKHKQNKIKHIPWRDVEYSVDEIGEYFEKKDVSGAASSRKPHKSCLASQLDKFSNLSNSPFMEYAKYDGRASGGLPTKKIEVFLTMAATEERAYPMTVVTLATAKVQDLIGLICWQYTTEGRQPAFKENVEAYALHIAEDDGEVDMDFPALDNKEPFSKFGFAKLALVEIEVKRARPLSAIVVTINMPNKGFSKIPLDNDNILMRELLNRVLKRRKLRVHGLEYRLEKQNEPGVTIGLDTPLSAQDCLEFCMVRENSVREDIEVEEEPFGLNEMAESLSSHQYKSYIVSLLHKLRTSTEVQLGVSGERIEIDPVAGKGLFFKQKANHYDMQCIASCSVMDEKTSGKATFRIVYSIGQHDFKHIDFECENSVAKEIVQKVNNILELRASPVRKDYKAHKEKKLHRRHTLGF